MTTNYYIFAGGGTGGHIYPGLAVADALKKLDPGAKIVFACSNRDIDGRILNPLDYGVVPQPVRPLPRSPVQIPGFLKAWISSSSQARTMIDDIKPKAVLGLGGFASGPVVKQASRRGVRTAMLNPDAIPGKANLHLAKYSQAIFTQFEISSQYFSQKITGRIKTVGCPIRGDFKHASREQAVEFFELRPDRMTLLINGGSLGAASINEAILELTDDLDELGEQWQILHITGPSGFARADSNHGKIHTVRIEYCDRMNLAYAVGDLALCRCGASTAAELAACGTASIIMPYPYHRDLHQLKNASELVANKAAEICMDTTDSQQNAHRLEKQLIGLMKNPLKVRQMQENALRAAKTDAAEVVAAWLNQAD